MIEKILLKAHRDYMKQTFNGMTVRHIERHPDFIRSLYATEAFFVEQVRNQGKVDSLIENEVDQVLLEKDESPAFAELTVSYL